MQEDGTGTRAVGIFTPAPAPNPRHPDTTPAHAGQAPRTPIQPARRPDPEPAPGYIRIPYPRTRGHTLYYYTIQ